MSNRKAIVCAALALAVPLPAYALTSGGEESSPAALSVSASLGSCGIASTQVVCMIDVSFEPLADARRYRASVTRADGSVIDFGSVGAGGASLPVTYVGAGTYSVTVSAYGHPKDGRKPELLDTDEAEAEPEKSDDAPVEKPRKRDAEGYEAAGQADEPAQEETAPAASHEPAAEVECVQEPADPTAGEPPAAPADEPAVEEDPGAESEEGSGGRDDREDAEEAVDAPAEEPQAAPEATVDPTCPTP